MSTTRSGGPHLRGRQQEWHVLQRTLPSVRGSVRLARMTTRVACRAWRVPAAEETAVLVASQLVTTALEHADAGQLTLRVLMTPRRLRLEVQDPSGLVPQHLGDQDEQVASRTLPHPRTVRWGAECRRPGAQLWAEIAL